MKEERFGPLRYVYSAGFPLGTDSLLLADFARCAPHSSVCDLGCGSGALSLLLLAREPTLQVTGVELSPTACSEALENVHRNALEKQLHILHGDLRQIRTLLPAGSFACAVSNPPYFPVGSGQPRRGQEGTAQTTEATCTPEELFAAAGWLLRWSGRFFVVHRPERLADLCCAARPQRLEAKRIRFVRARPQSRCSLILLEFQKGARPGLRYEPDLILQPTSI